MTTQDRCPNFIEIVNDAAQEIYEDNKDKGFWDLPEGLSLDPVTGEPPLWYIRLKKAEKIALMHSELSEGLEGVRKDLMDSHCPEYTSEEVELADALIRILDHAGKYKLRLGEAVLAKLDYNRSRPYKHGKKF